MFCTKHKVRWWIGENPSSSWNDETQEQQKQQLEELGIAEYTVLGHHDEAEMPEAQDLRLCAPTPDGDDECSSPDRNEVAG